MKIGFALVLSLAASVAHAGNAYIGFEVGAGDLDLDNVQVSPDFDVSLGTADRTVVFNLNGGYEFDNGLILQAATETTDQVSVFGLGDSVEVNVYKFGIGFSGSASERFRLNGTIGVNFWELEARESFFLNPGPEATGTIDGDDLYFDFGGAYLFNESVSLTFLYNYNDYEFGDAAAFRLGVRFRFSKQ